MGSTRSVKLVAQKNHRQRTTKHATEVTRGKLTKYPPLRSVKKKAQLDPTKNYFTIRHKFSPQNPILKLDCISRFVDSHDRSSCSFMFFSKSRTFQNESRVREQRILKISLPKHIRLEMNGLR